MTSLPLSSVGAVREQPARPTLNPLFDIRPLPPILPACYPPPMKNFLPLPCPLGCGDPSSQPTTRLPDFFETSPTPETNALRHGFEILNESRSRLTVTKRI